MTTLKEHQAAMVDLLANGSGIPASASRLAHAMHDVLEALSAGVIDHHGFGAWDNKNYRPVIGLANDATTHGLNDKALSKREKALKTDSPAKWPTPAEQRVKELENTIKQLRANNAKLKGQLALVREQRDDELRRNMEHEQAGCRKEDTQWCEHEWVAHQMLSESVPSKWICSKCAVVYTNADVRERLRAEWSGVTGGAGHGLSDNVIDPVRSK